MAPFSGLAMELAKLLSIGENHVEKINQKEIFERLLGAYGKFYGCGQHFPHVMFKIGG